ncbi:HNH endonuclease [Haloparvum sedimenti]|uniref:HNH endonuclease n=1 Tax=Haloparvum sedimenti TaxID=1678448 RepID=UPI00071E7294|nr:HNH endonuclease signature motif containing protein [Haloparvum sedimenti]
MSRTSTTYRDHGIESRYDDPGSYGERGSHYGNGRYPPDWEQRREAVWERQKYQCGRCGTYKGDASVNEVHHVVHLADGGSNALDNLVGLCGDCHALMHPDVDAISGTAGRAELFPNEYADDRVSVIREPIDAPDLATDVRRLTAFSAPDENANAVTAYTVPTSAETARRAESSLHRLLLDNDFVPRTSAYHRVTVRPRATGLLGAISSRGVDLTAESDAEVSTVEPADDAADGLDVYHSADATVSDLEIVDGAGESTGERVSLDHSDGARIRVEKPVSSPPLTAATAPEYALDAARYFGWGSAKLGVVPAVLLALFRPDLLPGGGSVAGVLATALLVGLLLRIPAIYRDATADPTDAVVDERSESS